MPKPRKIDQLSETHREWLREEIEKAGYADYEEISKNLNARLQASGSALRIQKTAIGEWGKELKEASRLAEFARIQDQTMAWSKSVANEMGIEGETQANRVLINAINALAFKSATAMMDEDHEVDPKMLRHLATIVRTNMAAGGLREDIIADVKARAQKEEREKVANEVEAAAAEMGITAESAAGLRRHILGVKAAA